MKKKPDNKPLDDKSLQELLSMYISASEPDIHNTPEQERILDKIRNRKIPVKRIVKEGHSGKEHIHTIDELNLNRKMQQGLSIIQHEYESLKTDMSRGIDIIHQVESWLKHIDHRLTALNFHFDWLEDINNTKDNRDDTETDSTPK